MIRLAPHPQAALAPEDAISVFTNLLQRVDDESHTETRKLLEDLGSRHIEVVEE